MAEAALRETEQVRANPDAWVMAADVGGTYARIGLVRADRRVHRLAPCRLESGARQRVHGCLERDIDA